jgi:DNA polymerase I-like protein with 3'-5' exonuclease and polymerase domains
MQFPRLDSADLISIDVETRDDDLEELGIGTTRDGYIAGLAVATRDAQWYLPVRHEGGGNLDRAAVFKWANDQLSTNIPKTGANLQYDLAYLWNEGVHVEGPFYDVQVAEPLLDENKFTYSLESLGQQYTGRGKNEDEMLEYIRQHFGAKAGKEKQYIWKCPADIVAPYAKEDVRLPIQILDQQLKRIETEGLQEVWQMESDLLPILVRMHLRGVRVDAVHATETQRQWTKELAALESSLNGMNPKSSKQVAAYLMSLGIEPPKTAKGNYSVQAKWLETIEDQAPLVANMMKASKYRTFLSTFIGGALRANVCGRIHGQFNQLKGDEYGTVTGRLSASKPNLQNIPNPEKDPYFSSQCRGIYLPEHGQEWLRYDFSQIEYRLLIHFASTLAGGVADVARQAYLDNPDTDFHQMCADLTGVTRKQAKPINFGMVYGMGQDKLARSLGVDRATAKRILAVYHEKAPYVKAFAEAAAQRAQNRGYVRTIAGRKRRFDFWESTKFIRKEDKVDGEVYMVKDKQTAVDMWGPVKRAHTHAAGNAVLQGSSADITKRAMVLGLKHGVYDVIGYPLVTVHDELGFSIETGNPAHEEAAKEMHRLMVDSYKLAVPVLVSNGRGKSWGEAE